MRAETRRICHLAQSLEKLHYKGCACVSTRTGSGLRDKMKFYLVFTLLLLTNMCSSHTLDMGTCTCACGEDRNSQVNRFFLVW